MEADAEPVCVTEDVALDESETEDDGKALCDRLPLTELDAV